MGLLELIRRFFFDLIEQSDFSKIASNFANRVILSGVSRCASHAFSSFVGLFTFNAKSTQHTQAKRGAYLKRRRGECVCCHLIARCRARTVFSCAGKLYN